MLRMLFFVSCYLALFGMATSAPFVLTLGYEWVDLLRPGSIMYGFAKQIPYALIMGVSALGSYFLFDRRDPPRIGMITILTCLIALWVTLTTTWALVPDAAWVKWDATLKTLAFSLFIPFVIRSRNQIEAFVQVYIFGIAANVITFGAKTLVTGGGYNRALGLISENKLLGEGANLATAALLMIPFIFFVMKHGRFFPKKWWVYAGYIGLMVLALATTIGTHERTGLMGMLVLAATVWWYSRYKFRIGLACIAAAAVIAYSAPASWYERMSTIRVENEDPGSAPETRLLVWKWTLDFVKTHPFGGGFEVYHVNTIVIPKADGRPDEVQHGRAFHSAYFEMLGEHGWIGLALFLSVLAAAMLSLRQVSRITRNNPEHLWASDLSRALRCCLLINMTGGAFIEIGFQPIIWYLIALSFALREYVRRVHVPETAASRLGFATPAIDVRQGLSVR